AHCIALNYFPTRRSSDLLDNIFIDIGAKDKAEVEKIGVHVGCVITYPDTFQILNKDKFVCRALDNRVGGFMIAEVARLLKENKKDRKSTRLNSSHVKISY